MKKKFCVYCGKEAEMHRAKDFACPTFIGQRSLWSDDRVFASKLPKMAEKQVSRGRTWGFPGK